MGKKWKPYKIQIKFPRKLMNINLFFRNVILGKIGDFFFQKCALLTKLAYIYQVMHITRLTRFLKKNGLYTSCDVYRAICQTLYWDYARHVNIVFSENGVYTSHDVYTRIYVTFILGPQEISSLLLFVWISKNTICNFFRNQVNSKNPKIAEMSNSGELGKSKNCRIVSKKRKW